MLVPLVIEVFAKVKAAEMSKRDPRSSLHSLGIRAASDVLFCAVVVTVSAACVHCSCR